MLKETLKIIGIAVTDSEPLVHPTGEVKRLPGSLEIEVFEGNIVGARPQDEDVPLVDQSLTLVTASGSVGIVQAVRLPTMVCIGARRYVRPLGSAVRPFVQ